jgi:hypothetical protein
MMPVDPCDDKVPLETQIRYVDQLQTDLKGIHLKNKDKQMYILNTIFLMVASGKIPNYEELTDDEHGNQIISELDPYNPTMSSGDWEVIGLQSM